ncbi:MAG: hypothetical protein K6F34_07395 [Lachnospiraceae bacterium]|nr:hypothetical protein [Lachnospiraceae bacterium]
MADIPEICRAPSGGLIFDREIKGLLPEEATVRELGIKDGDRLIYVSDHAGKGGEYGTVNCGLCEDESPARGT